MLLSEEQLKNAARCNSIKICSECKCSIDYTCVGNETNIAETALDLQKQNGQLTQELRVLREQLPEASKKIVKLPCNVGDKVYVDKDTLHLGRIYWKRCLLPKVIECEVINIRFTKKQKLIKVNPLIEENMNSRMYKLYPFSSIGITVFLTREEADKVIGGGQ